MLRINTPAGLSTAREEDVSTAPDVLACWDALRRDGKTCHYDNALAAEELVHCLKGEVYHR